VNEAQQIAVDMSGIEGHRITATGQQDAAVRVAEQQHRRTVGIGGIAGLELTTRCVDRPQRTDGSVRGGVVAAVHVRGSSREAAAAQFVVLEPAEVGMQSPRRLAFAQVDERFHQWPPCYRQSTPHSPKATSVGQGSLQRPWLRASSRWMPRYQNQTAFGKVLNLTPLGASRCISKARHVGRSI
jgi:hypothetical protein